MAIREREIKEFPWGEIISVKTVTDEIDIIIYKPWIYEKGRATQKVKDEYSYHPFVKGKDTCHSYETLHEAIIYSIASLHLEVNEAGYATTFFSRMLRLGEKE